MTRTAFLIGADKAAVCSDRGVMKQKNIIIAPWLTHTHKDTHAILWVCARLKFIFSPPSCDDNTIAWSQCQLRKRNANYAIALLIAACPKEIWRRNILCEWLIVEETGRIYLPLKRFSIFRRRLLFLSLCVIYALDFLIISVASYISKFIILTWNWQNSLVAAQAFPAFSSLLNVEYRNW